ncbi:SDR family NAD(P)-dependent oxidoreductase [Thalassotalea euphylliae]|uniref:SDR family NAD(P)-dependent oxidoreductase n=1 Tax=Thalassotalea euphylliae TaxID=1655234 RepID=A0A3E0U1H8_9GAMM|nr:SDR family NAD(P)-dependent oxidoreductase [Thalassotalea euphylliae]REL30457.1 SDR family NAD(P)-dependent oxidoreductase [Thalassotalea euphylliae]
MIKSVLITGANAGLGKEAAKQLAAKPDIEKIYLGCRNKEKAKAAQTELAASTGRNIFEILLIDVSDLNSVRQAVKRLPESIDALVMNAGGTGGRQYDQLTSDGVTNIFAVNLLGHALLTEQLIEAGKLKYAALYAGSEAARGVEEMGMKRPNLTTSSVDEFAAIANGSLFEGSQFKGNKDATDHYGSIKYMAAMWMSAMARQHPNLRFITMSPGATVGTDGFNTLPLVKQLVMKTMMRFMLLLGKVHGIETGAKRYVDGLFNSEFRSGGFYASLRGLTGVIGEQGRLFSDIDNRDFKDNAYQAVQQLISSPNLTLPSK